MSSEISSSSSVAADNVGNTGTTTERPCDSIEQADEDLGDADAASLDAQSVKSELLSVADHSEAATGNNSPGDDGSASSVSDVSNPQPEPIIADHSQPPATTESEETAAPDNHQDDNSSFVLFFVDLRKMVVQYGRELICLFALVLTTYATLQNGPPKVSRAPPPTPLFAKDSMVQEWPSGHLNVIQGKVSMSELSLVLFYAPWCAESQFAKLAYEEVANKYYKEAYFAAVNCWQPGGECRLQYAKVQVWPVLMVYYPKGVAVQYNGPWLVQPLSRFIEGLIKPYVRISNRNELDALRMDSNSVTVGFFSSAELKRSEFFTFVQSAIKWLERDPYQDVQFAVVTGESYRNFNVTRTPSMRLYNWNETMEVELTTKWSVENITKWLKDRLNFITTWIHPPGKKSTTLAPYLKAGPTVLFFTPKDYYTFNKDAYHLLKQVTLEYHKCQNDTQPVGMSGNAMHLIREENFKKYLTLKTTCANISLSTTDDDDPRSFKGCSSDDEPNITFANVLNNSKYDKLLTDTDNYCYIGPKNDDAKSSSCMLNEEWRDKFKVNFRNRQTRTRSPLSMLRPEDDDRSALKLREQFIRDQCYALRLSDNGIGNVYFKNEKKLEMGEFVAKASEFNKTLSFIMLDSIMYKPIATRLGIDVNMMPKKTSLMIVDNENDSAYQMKGEISTQSVITFIKNFIAGSIKRKLRSTKKTSSPSTENNISIREVSSIEFREHLKFSRKTIVVLFYSVQCALCSLFSSTLLIVSRILKTPDIEFLRIDSDLNDFQWHYTMDTYPTLLIFPRNRTLESRVFPHSMEVSISNILGFIIANLTPEERLQAIYETCQFRRTTSSVQNCLQTMREEISKNIARNLRHWRHYPQHRSKFLRKLQILRRIQLSSFQLDSRNNFENMRQDFIQLKQLRDML